MTTAHVPLVVTATTTRAQIQAEIARVRHIQSRLPDAFARTHDAEVNALLDALLAREPEPA